MYLARKASFPVSDRPLSTRALRIALATALAWGVLVAAHEGEFYPFSIFPMFSQAGKPWTRVLVQEAEAPPYDWSYRGLDSLNGLIPLLPLGVPQNDVSTFVGSWLRRRVGMRPCWYTVSRGGLREMWRRSKRTRWPLQRPTR